MIIAEFSKKGNSFKAFEISGHSDYSRSGSDIVCAGVSACVEMTVNGITDVLKESCDVCVNDDSATISLALISDYETMGSKFIEALYLQLNSLSKRYPLNIKVFSRKL